MPRARPAPQRFDDHFIVRTIRDFFLSLLIIITVELGLRFALMAWTYRTAEAARTEAAATRLAEDVRSIMLNQGGPVAARTVYPVIRRNHEQLGLSIAIEPAPATVEAITDLFGTAPRGIPARWPDGPHHEARVELRADEFCVSCHHLSEPGDVLGWVTVRNYRETHLARWWHDVRLSGIFGMGNVIMHTIVLFVLLRLRMEPLLGLRAVVGRLARAGSDLSHRAVVRSADEFGELAHDLNHFLDRLTQIIDDMSRVLTEIADMSLRMQDLGDGIEQQARALGDDAGHLPPGGAAGASGLADILLGIEALAGHLEMPAAERARLGEIRARLGALSDSGTGGDRLRTGIRALGSTAGEMRVLEERMRALASEGQRLIARLGRGPADPPEQPGPAIG